MSSWFDQAMFAQQPSPEDMKDVGLEFLIIGRWDAMSKMTKKSREELQRGFEKFNEDSKSEHGINFDMYIWNDTHVLAFRALAEVAAQMYMEEMFDHHIKSHFN